MWRFLLLLVLVYPVYAADLIKEANKLHQQKNYREAFEKYKEFYSGKEINWQENDHSLSELNKCLQNFNKQELLDPLLKTVLENHLNDPIALKEVANALSKAGHQFIKIDNKIIRSQWTWQRNTEQLNGTERNRSRALALILQAIDINDDEKLHKDLLRTAIDILMMNRHQGQSWRLQYLTDLNTPADYEPDRYSNDTSGAPVNNDGSPIFYESPKSLNQAKNDGERWRWLLTEYTKVSEDDRYELEKRAKLSYQQFGVQTIRTYSRYSMQGKSQLKFIEQLKTLSDDETIAYLATGIQRFKLPDEHNFLKIWHKLKERNHLLSQNLAEAYLNRMQYQKALQHYKQLYKMEQGKWILERIKDIEAPTGEFLESSVQLPGKAELKYKFRNSKEITLKAREVKIDSLIKAYQSDIEANPIELTYRHHHHNLGHELINGSAKKFLGEEKASWELKLEPRENHFDKIITINLPLQKTGVYLIEAKNEKGQIARSLVWLSDSVISKKAIDKAQLYMFSDSLTGAPLKNVNVEFFAYRKEWIDHKKLNQLSKRRYNYHSFKFTKKTDKNGWISIGSDIIKRDGKNWQISCQIKDQNRFGLSNYQSLGLGHYPKTLYSQNKTYVITDRPVYKPAQKIHFSAWSAYVDYKNPKLIRNSSTTVRIHNPKGEKVYDKKHKYDEHGSLTGEFELPAEAMLGNWSIRIHHAYQKFRVEEYKKPEFEVKVKVPEGTILLGDKIPLEISADYYFGGAVKNAKAKVKVTRKNFDLRWFPYSPWDWFYGNGYWWFSPEYNWYPGWHNWACKRPIYSWYRNHHQTPELVASMELKTDANGKIKTTIDTAMAKILHGDKDHQYSIEVEVTDDSRRTIMANSTIPVTREAFKVYSWLDKGYYFEGDKIVASFRSQNASQKAIDGKVKFKLYKINFKDGEAQEKVIFEQDGEVKNGNYSIDLTAQKAGQYRASLLLDNGKHQAEGSTIFYCHGKEVPVDSVKFNKLELILDKKEYKAGESAKLMINTARRGATVWLFLRPHHNVYPKPIQVKLDGKSSIYELPLSIDDMPNIFVEAMTIYNGQVHHSYKEIFLPPMDKQVKLKVSTDKKEYLPGEEVKIDIQASDLQDKDISGLIALSVYDRAIDYIAGSAKLPNINETMWKWRRHFNPETYTSLSKNFWNVYLNNEVRMRKLGLFGDFSAFGGGVTSFSSSLNRSQISPRVTSSRSFMSEKKAKASSDMRFAAADEAVAVAVSGAALSEDAFGDDGSNSENNEVKVRTKFADLAYWNGKVLLDKNGHGKVSFTAPENLSSWKIQSWYINKEVAVGQEKSEIKTRKNVMLRLQVPRFLIESDEVIISANLHNEFDSAQEFEVALENSDEAELIGKKSFSVKVEPHGQKRIDWRFRIIKEGDLQLTVKALNKKESDAMQLTVPVKVHGMQILKARSHFMEQSKNELSFMIDIPKKFRPESTYWQMNYSPTVAGAMLDALPYLVSYPYGCTEQTLNRFIPTAVVQQTLVDLGFSLEDIRQKRINLNAQELGDPSERAQRWKQKHIIAYDVNGDPIFDDTPVFSEALVQDMIQAGINRLNNMQNSDGGWGWFSGHGERSYPHTTAVVLNGLSSLKNQNQIYKNIFNNGLRWLQKYQKKQLDSLKSHQRDSKKGKSHANNLDAFIFYILTKNKKYNNEMYSFLMKDKNYLSIQSKAMMALSCQLLKKEDDMNSLKRNIEQFLVIDEENQTAYLDIQHYWFWYGSETETMAWYLKLMTAVDPKAKTAAYLSKYLINNRRHGHYWNSTRDTALIIEALAGFMKKSGQLEGDMDLEILVDDKVVKNIKINRENLFSYDSKLVLTGEELQGGQKKITLRKKGDSPLYINDYLDYFSLEDFINKNGLEVKIERRLYKLIEVDTDKYVSTSKGHAHQQKIEKYQRQLINNNDTVKSGDLIEVELIIESKNDYEYLLIEDAKAAGMEAISVQSGYSRENPGVYIQYRNDRVSMFTQLLPRGKHSFRYKLKAEVPGKFSALPARIEAMYSPELRGNSNEIKLKIVD